MGEKNIEKQVGNAGGPLLGLGAQQQLQDILGRMGPGAHLPGMSQSYIQLQPHVEHDDPHMEV